MSIFKEKDDILRAAFTNIFHSDSESDLESEVDTLQSNVNQNDHQEQNEASPLKQFGGDSFIHIDNDEEDTASKNNTLPEDHRPATPPTKTTSEHSVEVIDVSNDNEPASSEGILTRSRRKRIISSQNVITISDDDDDIIAVSDLNATNQPSSNSLHNSQLSNSQLSAKKIQEQEDDHDFNLKVIVAGSLKLFRIKYHTKMNDALKDMINDFRSDNKCLILTFNDKVVPMDESPSSLNLTSGNILKAIVASDLTKENSNRPGEIIVKVQDGHRKHTMEFKILKNEPILELKTLYAKQFKINNTDKIKLFFDGDVVEENLTPEELDIEDDCVLDVMIST